MNDMTLKSRREAAGKTIRQVAAALGVTERTYSRWEAGEVIPDGPNLIRLADYFKVHPRKLVNAEPVAKG